MSQSSSAPSIHEFLLARAVDAARAGDPTASALRELVATHAATVGVRTDYRMPRPRWSRRTRDKHAVDALGPVCEFCAPVVGGNRVDRGFPCPPLLAAAEWFRDHPDWQDGWMMHWADWD